MYSTLSVCVCSIQGIPRVCALFSVLWSPAAGSLHSRTHRPMLRARTDGLVAFPYRWLPPKLTEPSEGESSSSQSTTAKLNLKRLSRSWRSTLPVQVSFKILNDTVINDLLWVFFIVLLMLLLFNTPFGLCTLSRLDSHFPESGQ